MRLPEHATGEPLAPVTIGLREVYDAVQGVRADVQDLRTAATQRAEVDADHEARLRVLERARWPLPALAVLISAAALLLAVVRPGH